MKPKHPPIRTSSISSYLGYDDSKSTDCSEKNLLPTPYKVYNITDIYIERNYSSV